MEKEEVEALLPKGATELTKQQIRYLLQVSDIRRPFYLRFHKTAIITHSPIDPNMTSCIDPHYFTYCVHVILILGQSVF